MTADTANWLRGHIDALRAMGGEVERLVGLHAPEAAKELEEVKYACNRTWNAIHEAVQQPERG